MNRRPMFVKGSFSGLLAVHGAVFLFGFAGLFAKFLTLPPDWIVWGRTFFAAIALYGAACRYRTPLGVKSHRHRWSLFALGALLALHWIAFFHAIQISSVGIGLLAFATFPVFVTLLEPPIFGTRYKGADFLAVGGVLAGLLLIHPSFDWHNHVTRGFAWGGVAALSFAVLTIANRMVVRQHAPLVVGFYQNATASGLLLILLVLRPSSWLLPSLSQWGLLILLGTVCTALAHVLFISGLRSVRAHVAGIIVALEPVYGIVFAWWLLDEVPAARMIAGGVIIVAVCALLSGRPNPVSSDSHGPTESG